MDEEHGTWSLVPKLVLNNNEKIPIIGLRICGSLQGNVCQAVMDAIDTGYRHFDCDNQNAKAVGVGVNAKIDEGVVKREDLFITSKISGAFSNPDLVRSACDRALKSFGLQYLDMFLWQWPMDKIIGADYSTQSYVDIWKEMEKLVDDDLTRCIGVSNFDEFQIQRIMDVALIQPATNQIECHPYIYQNALMKFCKERNIAITAFSPMGGSRSKELALLSHPKIEKIARYYGKTPAQILIRYQLDRGNIVIPQTLNKAHMEGNLDVFDFELTAEDEKKIESIRC